MPHGDIGMGNKNGISYCGDKMVINSSYLHNKICYTVDIGSSNGIIVIKPLPKPMLINRHPRGEYYEI